MRGEEWRFICLMNNNKKTLVKLLSYLDEGVETPLTKHVLEEGVVFWAADMRLQLRGQCCQQLIQT